MTAYDELPQAIRSAVDNLPDRIFQRSVSIFYSGKEAFAADAPLYVLGLNPGGTPSALPTATVAAYLKRFKDRDQPWCEYADESWEGAASGTWGMQPRVLHMFGQLGLDPRTVPASNVVFVNTRNERDLAQEKDELLDLCWPVHAAVINSLKVSTIVCFGGTAGLWARTKLGASEMIDSFTEENSRGWTSRTHRNPDGIQVLTVTHPSRADWRNPLADPTPLVRRALEGGVKGIAPLAMDPRGV